MPKYNKKSETVLRINGSVFVQQFVQTQQQFRNDFTLQQEETQNLIESIEKSLQNEGEELENLLKDILSPYFSRIHEKVVYQKLIAIQESDGNTLEKYAEKEAKRREDRRKNMANQRKTKKKSKK